MRVQLVICFIFFFASSLKAQNQSIDSLRSLLKNSSGITRVDQLNAYANAIRSYDVNEARNSVNEALTICKKINYTKGELEGLLNSGIIESNSGNDSLGISILKKGLDQTASVKNQKLRAKFLSQLGWIEHFETPDSAEKHLNAAYLLLRDSLNPSDLSFVYLSKAQFYQTKGELKNYLNYLNRSWRIQKKLGSTRAFFPSGLELAAHFERSGEYKTALAYLDTIQTGLGQDTIANDEISSIRRARGIIYANMGYQLKALDLFAQSKKFYEKNNSNWDLSDLFFEVGNVQSDMANYEISLKYFAQALRIAENKKFTNLIVPIYFRTAWVYFQLKQYPLAETYCQKALDLAVKDHKELDESSAINLLGLLALQQNQIQKAIDHFQHALLIRKKHNNPARVASTLLNIGIAYNKSGDYKKAEEYHLESLKIEEQINHAYGIIEARLNLGQLYLHQKRANEAYNQLTQADILARKIQTKDLLSDVYKLTRDYWLAKADYVKSLEYSLKYEALRDSIINENLANRILTLRHDFELDQKENEIKILNQESQLTKSTLALQKSEINRQRIIIGVGIIFFIGIAALTMIIYIYYKKVKKLNDEISEQNEEINVQSEKLRAANTELTKLNLEVSEQKEEIQAQAEELIESNRAIAQVNEVLEENVKARTAELKDAYQELDTFFYRSSHDFRRPLTTFMGLAEVAKIMIKEKSALDLFDKVNITAHSLDKMLVKLQSVSLIGSADLVHAEVFFENIFQSELNEFQNELLAKKIEVITKVELKDRFYSYPALIKVIVQNLLENSISFAAEEKTKIFLSVEQFGEEIHISVVDNGQGIDPTFITRVFEMYFRANEKSTGNGLGLYIVKKAVDKLRGTIKIVSQLGQGTDVRIFLPRD
ncbi:MAG TPA: hypothetical protein DGG95_08955 [Cytophagales bacterium]|nr:hypothetical protein [Cytophagales bacterium]